MLAERYAAGERDFRGMKMVAADLRSAMLEDADLSGAILASASLTGAKLRGANLHDANLLRADLAGADLRGARLTDAHLLGADLALCDLTDADLTGADLARVNLHGAVLHGTICANVRLGHTVLMDLNLEDLILASPAPRHAAPSSVDHRAIIKSIHCRKLKNFLGRIGMPLVFIEYMVDCAHFLSLEGSIRMLQSTFISYGGPDTAFAERLNEALAKNGVTTFLFVEDAIPGTKIHRVMRDGVNQHDRVILICSKASLDRTGVLNEINQTLQRETREAGKECLIPITLDDYVFSDWTPDDPTLAREIRERVVADFRGTDADLAKFDQALQRLIGALKK